MIDDMISEEIVKTKNKLTQTKEKALNLYTKMSIVLLVFIFVRAGAFMVDVISKLIGASEGVMTAITDFSSLMNTIIYFSLLIVSITIIYINIFKIEMLENELIDLKRVEGMNMSKKEKTTTISEIEGETSDEMELIKLEPEEEKQKEEYESLSDYDYSEEHEQ